MASARRYGPRLCQRPDLLWVESPPLFIGYAARSLSRRWHCPYVFNVSDLWPESAIRMGIVKPGLATWLAERLGAEALSTRRRRDGPVERDHRLGAPRVRRDTRTDVMTNGVDPARFGRRWPTPRPASCWAPSPGPIFIFAGLFGLAQGLDQILDIAAKMPADQPGRFVLVGEGPEREQLVERIEREHIRRVRLVPAQPRERIPALLAAADVAVISLGMAIPGAVPSKIYEAMASSLPILLIADGEAARRVEQAACGLAVRPGDLAGAAEAVTDWPATAPARSVGRGRAPRRRDDLQSRRNRTQARPVLAQPAAQ